MAVTLVLAMAVPLVLPARFSLGPRWAVPAVEVLLLVAIIATDQGHIDRRSAVGRALSLALVAVLVAECPFRGLGSMPLSPVFTWGLKCGRRA
jgi:hypothetical protein